MGNNLSRRCIPCASHPDSAWSGLYYADAGTENQDRPLCGVLEFLDPRVGAEAVSAPEDLYGEPFRVRPQAGLLVVFPSWLYHWVHPYTGERPRIAISFNAAVEAHAANQPQSSEAIASSVASDIAHKTPGYVIGWAATVEDLNSHADKV
jgi:hypothetical protein